MPVVKIVHQQYNRNGLRYKLEVSDPVELNQKHYLQVINATTNFKYRNHDYLRL